MHLCFGAASPVVSAPVSPDRTAEMFRCPQGLVSGDRASGDGLPRPRVLAGRDNGVGTTVSDRIMAFARIIGAVSGDAADLLACWDLAEQVGQDRCISDVAPGDFDRSNLQCLLVDAEVDLAPDAPFGAAVLARVPLAFALNLDAGAVDQQVQRPFGATIRDVDGEGLLAAAQRAEVGHRPVKPDQAQQAFDEPRRLPECHAEQHLHGKAGLDRAIAVALPAATPACRCGLPAHLGIEPDRQRAPALERFVIGRPVLGPVGRWCRSAHAPQLPRWLHEMNPSRDLCNRAMVDGRQRITDWRIDYSDERPHSALGNFPLGRAGGFPPKI